MSTTSSNSADAPELATPVNRSPAHAGPLQRKLAPTLPNEPVAIIEPSRAWNALNLRDLWHYRELLYFLVWRDIKVRYKQTAVGVAWVVIQPVFSALIFTIFLGKLARVPSDQIPYVLFVYPSLAFWTFFSAAVTQGGSSIVGSAHLITKVYFPRLIIPTAAVIARLLDLGIAFMIMLVLLAYYRMPLSPSTLLLPVPLILGILLALGMSMLTSALNVKYRDVSVALPVLVQLWMFASPVVYPSSLVPEKYRTLYELNPLVGILENLRAALFGGSFYWRSLAISAIFTLALVIYAAFAFRRVERSFADIV